MNTAPQFSLRWNNYVNHVTDAFNILRLENDLVDVTLCCEGGKIKAHRVLLSACSIYFKQIFKENPCQHPVIIFKNVKFEDLTAIINFMYHGEVNILQEQLESFLITAEMLQVKGLSDSLENENSKVQSVSKDNISLDLTAKSGLEEPIQNVAIEEPINLAPMQNSKEENVPFTTILPAENEGTDIKPDDSIDETPPPKRRSTGQQSEDMQIDNQNSTIEDNERNTNESELAKFWCQLCPKGFKHPTSLTLHKDSHAGKTQCPVCYRSFSRSYDMRSHLQRIHQGKQLTIKEIRYKSTNDSVAPKQFTHNI